MRGAEFEGSEQQDQLPVEPKSDILEALRTLPDDPELREAIRGGYSKFINKMMVAGTRLVIVRVKLPAKELPVVHGALVEAFLEKEGRVVENKVGLSIKERECLVERHGLTDGVFKEHSAVAEKVGITAAESGTLTARGISKLRNSDFYNLCRNYTSFQNMSNRSLSFNYKPD